MRHLETDYKKLSDYTAPECLIKKVGLVFNIEDGETIVSSELQMCPQTELKSLVLQGIDLNIKTIKINEQELSKHSWSYDGKELTLLHPPSEPFLFQAVVGIAPEKNTNLEGLYQSGNILCTQNEPEGMRHITFFLDRPDVMSIFTTKIIASKKKYPILLSNGNCIEEGEAEEGKHYAVWHDPFPKPCYLFAVVAGNLGVFRDTFLAADGRTIDLRIYCDPGNEDQCAFAMECLKRSMKWDEDHYKRIYDLDIYMIVAVDSFNMGGMENKGLNLFNSSYVLANTKTATDTDMIRIMNIVAHEYFHNWSGNRITCRDWFQLTLKEGFTVLREQEFYEDFVNPAISRTDSVSTLKRSQFPLDAGPNAHPIRPDKYIEINNFYTATVYEKGAEVIRMLKTLVGAEAYHRATCFYFDHFDGQAVTTEDFISAFEQTLKIDLTDFKRWYQQVGTPQVEVSAKHEVKDNSMHTLQLRLTQVLSPGHSLPVIIPFRVGLLNEKGEDIIFQCEQKGIFAETPKDVLVLNEWQKTFILQWKGENNAIPVLSLNRGFSAPVEVLYQGDIEGQFLIAKSDRDFFQRLNTLNHLKILTLLTDCPWENWAPISFFQHGLTYDAMLERCVSCVVNILEDSDNSDEYKAECLGMPGMTEILNHFLRWDVGPLDHAFQKFRKDFAKGLAKTLDRVLTNLDTSFSISPFSTLDETIRGRKALALGTLKLLLLNDPQHGEALKVLKTFFASEDMTLHFGALKVATAVHLEIATEWNHHFADKWAHNNQVLQRWMEMLMSTADSEAVAYERLEQCQKHKAFTLTVPNWSRSLYRSFVQNVALFHHEGGKGHRFILARVQELDKLNPTASSRLLDGLDMLGKLPEQLRKETLFSLQELYERSDISKNIKEKINNLLTLA
jgi:aminopeptidase N